MSSNINNKISNLSFDPRDLSREELLSFLKLPSNANKNEITTKIDDLLDRQDDPSIENFLYLVLSLLTKPSENISNSVFSQEYIGREPKNQTILGPNVTQIKTDNPSKFNYNVQVEQGKKNPRYIEKYTSYLIINSALRPNPMTTPSQTFSVDVNMHNVLSLRLASVYITPSWYNFDYTFGNTFFYIKTFDATILGLSPNTIYYVLIPPGNYNIANDSSNNILDNLNSAHFINMLTSIDTNVEVRHLFKFEYDNINNKVYIQLISFENQLSVIFYDPTLPSVTDISSSIIVNIPQKLNYNLGYYLGFRGTSSLSNLQNGVTIDNFKSNKLIIDLSYSDPLYQATPPPIYAAAQINLNNSINAILSIDDYNKNVFPNKINLIKPPNKRVSLPSYYNKNIKCDDTNGNIVIDTSGQGLTIAQTYTMDEILNQNSNSFYLETFGGGGGSANELATFNLNHAITNYKRFSREDNTQRIYTGEVNLGKLKINLMTTNGIPLNLHNSDWEILLEIEQHYQSLNS